MISGKGLSQATETRAFIVLLAQPNLRAAGVFLSRGVQFALLGSLWVLPVIKDGGRDVLKTSHLPMHHCVYVWKLYVWVLLALIETCVAGSTFGKRGRIYSLLAHLSGEMTSLFSPSSITTYLWCHKLGQLTPTDQRDISDPTTSYSAYKAEGRRKNGMKLGEVVLSLSFLKCFVWWNPAFLEMAVHGKWSVNSLVCFASLACVAFTIKLFLSQPRGFLTFTLPVLCPIPRGERASGGVGLSCQLGLSHGTRLSHKSLQRDWQSYQAQTWLFLVQVFLFQVFSGLKFPCSTAHQSHRGHH